MVMGELPFIFGKLPDGDNFTDREEDSTYLEARFKSLGNTTIISPRRWGKTSLVEHVANKIRRENENMKVCLVDIFNVRDEMDFYEQFANEILKQTSNKWEEIVGNAKRFLARLSPTVSLSVNQQVKISFSVNLDVIRRSQDDILDLPETIAKDKGINLIVCVDEFQSISDFPESLAFQRKLRAHWQRHRDVGYCLYGSKRTMLLDIFSNPVMPFYKFGDILFLQKISNENWGAFIKKRFEDTNKKITSEQARYLAETVDNHPYYVQQLAQQSWLRTNTSCNTKIIDESLQGIKNQLSLLFTGQVETMAATQLNFLKAVINGETTFASQENLKRYKLGSSANLTRIKNALISREIIDITTKKVEILDPVFKLWLKEDYFKQ